MEHVPSHQRDCIGFIDMKLASLKAEYRQLKRARKILGGAAADVAVVGSIGPLAELPAVTVRTVKASVDINDIVKWLEANPGWHTATHIAEQLNASGRSVGQRLRHNSARVRARHHEQGLEYTVREQVPV